MYFEKPGPANTDATLEIAKQAVEARGIKHVLIASTIGDTGVKAARIFAGGAARLVVVTHNAGFKREGVCELDPGKAEEIEKLGGRILTSTLITRGLGCAIRERCGNYSEEVIVADTLRIMGQGVKVCVEMAAMACDAGLIPPGDVIAVAGTGRGADTCLLVKANSSNRFFDIRVKEVLAKPLVW
jgi:uncharacterized protein